MPRYQLPVASWVDPAAFWPALRAMARGGDEARDGLSAALRERFGAGTVLLTQSGTAALVAALRLTVRPGAAVAFPGYACVDLAAAAIRAGVRVRVYDLDPETMSPDLESVARVLSAGVEAVVVAHLFGYPADVPGVRRLAAAAGVAVIEDAAQGAGGRLGGKLAGALADLAVLSFGRGKGTSGGGGGALLGFGAEAAARVESVRPSLGPGGGGGHALLVSLAQWGLGRPAVYGLPAHVPGLNLGEMVYHPAPEPAGISAASAVLAGTALAHVAADVAVRRANALAIEDAVRAPDRAIRLLPGAEPGYLRVPVRMAGGAVPVPRLGVMQGYPRSLLEQPELTPRLLPDQAQTPGARTLREELVTLPAHHLLAKRDLHALRDYLAAQESHRARPLQRT